MKPPEFIEFEIGTYCNRACHWCPNVLNSRGNEKNHVSPALWSKFLQDLHANQYTGILAIHNYNEPLLDPYVYERINDARTISPQTKVSIFTNGDPLNAAVLEKLISLGIYELRVTLYPKLNTEGKYKDYGLDKLLKRTGINLSTFNYVDSDRGKEYRGIFQGVNILIIIPIVDNYTNRGGSVMIEHTEKRTEPCYLPDHSVAIDYLGNFKLCCQLQDVIGDSIYNLGNVADNGFFKLWNSKKLERIRTQLRNSNFSSLNYCSNCDHSKEYELKKAA